MNEESLWFNISKNGVLRYDKKTLEYLAIPVPKNDTTFYKEDIHTPFSVYKIYRDKIGKLWLGTFNRGVVGYDGKSFEYHNPDNFGVGTIRSIFQDDSGTNWFGSNGGGLYKYDGKFYTNFTKENGLVGENPGYDEPGTLARVWAINQDEVGNMWFGTIQAGLWKYDGNSLVNFTKKDGLPSNSVETIYKDSKGELWFCSGINSNKILYTFNEKSVEIMNKNNK